MASFAPINPKKALPAVEEEEKEDPAGPDQADDDGGPFDYKAKKIVPPPASPTFRPQVALAPDQEDLDLEGMFDPAAYVYPKIDFYDLIYPKDPWRLPDQEEDAKKARDSRPPWILYDDPALEITLKAMFPKFLIPPHSDGNEIHQMPIREYIAGLFNYEGHMIREEAVEPVAAGALLRLAIGDIEGVKIFPSFWYLNQKSVEGSDMSIFDYMSTMDQRILVWLIYSTVGKDGHWGVGLLDQKNGEVHYFDSSPTTRNATAVKWLNQLIAWLKLFKMDPTVKKVQQATVAPLTGQTGDWECSLLAIEAIRVTMRDHQTLTDSYEGMDWETRSLRTRYTTTNLRKAEVERTYLAAIRRELGEEDEVTLRSGHLGKPAISHTAHWEPGFIQATPNKDYEAEGKAPDQADAPDDNNALAIGPAGPPVPTPPIAPPPVPPPAKKKKTPKGKTPKGKAPKKVVPVIPKKRVFSDDDQAEGRLQAAQIFDAANAQYEDDQALGVPTHITGWVGWDDFAAILGVPGVNPAKKKRKKT